MIVVNNDAVQHYYYIYCVVLTGAYGLRFTVVFTHNKLKNMLQIKNPIKFNIDDAIKMYLNAPITSLQFKSLK